MELELLFSNVLHTYAYPDIRQCPFEGMVMLAGTTTDRFESSVPRKVLRLLEGLKRSEAGAAIFKHIERLLEDSEATHAEVEQAYASILEILLSAYARHLPNGSQLQVQLKLIQMHITPPLSASELSTLRRSIEQYAEKIVSSETVNREILERALTPLLEDFSVGKSGVNGERTLAPETSSRTTEPAPTEETTQEYSSPQKVERRVDTSYRQHLNEKRESVQKIQETLIHQITETIRQNEEFGVLLEVELDALQQSASIQELDILRKTLVSEVEKLLHAQQTLASNLDSTHNYLQVVEADSQQLSDELSRVHLLSLTDDLTNLPNRRAFMRRLEDEVGRVQRYGNNLSLILIDLDSFKSINDKLGHAGGDEVLRTYARKVLSIFRHHDMVARYGGEEFAILLPNTANEGAFAAISKVQKRVAETSFDYNAQLINVPTFSAGIALYKPGETPTDLIERADTALYRAKRLGRNRAELAVPEDSDALTSN